MGRRVPSAPPGQGPPPTWSTWREALTVLRHPPHVRKALLVAAVVGTLLFSINQLDVVLGGEATLSVWVKAAVTYLVPYGVSSYGILVASHRRAGDLPR